MRKLCTSAALLTLWAAATLVAGDVKIIANSSVGASSISPEEVKGVFLVTKTSLSDGSHVEPVIAKGGPAHEAFLKEFVGKSDSAFETYLRGLVFTGKASMPKTATSEAEMVAYVAKTKGAIGYVSADASTDGVKTLEVK
jgi:hypothetical protein